MVKKVVGLMLVAALVGVNAQSAFANATLAREAATLAGDSKTFARFMEGMLGRKLETSAEGKLTVKEQAKVQEALEAQFKSAKNSRLEQALTEVVSKTKGLSGGKLESQMVVALSTGQAAEMVKSNAAQQANLVSSLAGTKTATQEPNTCSININGVSSEACKISTAARANLEKGVKIAGDNGRSFAQYIMNLNGFTWEQAVAGSKKIAGCAGVADGCNLLTGALKSSVCGM